MELAISIISLVTALIALLTSVLPSTLNMRRNVIDFRNKYDEFRSSVASVLTMYACYFHNPVDLAKTEDHRLPQKYDIASDELRNLGATAKALSAIVPANKKKLPIAKEELNDVSGYLIGLSNSMSTPYNCCASAEELRAVREWQSEIKRLLDID